jgi:sugar lactone lactonase YvrE
MEADTAATGGRVWQLRGGLDNNHLDTGADAGGNGTSGGGMMFAIGNPLSLTTTIRGRVQSDYDTSPSVPIGAWQLHLYRDTAIPIVNNISFNSSTGWYEFTVPSLVPGANYYLETAGTPEKHRNVQTATFKLVDGQQKTVDLILDKHWMVSTLVAGGITTPAGMTAVGDYLYITSLDANQIKKVAIASGVVENLAGSGSQSSSAGVGALASFNKPEGIVAVDPDTLYVSEKGSAVLRKIEISSQTVSNSYNAGATLWGITATGGSFYVLTGNSVKKLTAGIVTNTVTGFFNEPEGITPDNAGRFLYVANNITCDVMKVDINNLTPGGVSVLAGTGSGGSIIDGIGTAARFNNLRDIVIDSQDKFLYVADVSNCAIRRIEIATGKVITIAGNGPAYVDNVIGPTARFFYCYGITFDAKGDLYVTEYNHGRIRKLTRDW